MARDTTTDDNDGARDLDALADRLEAALERIVRHLEAPKQEPPANEVAARLDKLIGRLRGALGSG